MKTNVDQHRTVTVEDRLGLHMRVAQQIVKAAQRFSSTLTIRRGAVLADARSILSVLVLGAVQGVTLDLHASGIDAEQALDEIAHLIDTQCDDRPREAGDRLRRRLPNAT